MGWTSYDARNYKINGKGIKVIDKKAECDSLFSNDKEYKILNAFTSNFVINKLKEKSNISVLSFSEALDNMYDEKIEDITILPLYILPGGQYEGVKKVLHCYKEKFDSIKIAKPLLNGEKNEFQDVILAIKSHLPKDKGIVLVGHGTKDEYNKFEAGDLYINSSWVNTSSEFKGKSLLDRAQIVDLLTKSENKRYEDYGWRLKPFIDDKDHFETLLKELSLYWDFPNIEAYKDDYDLEIDFHEYTTPSGDNIVVMCKYGYDG